MSRAKAGEISRWDGRIVTSKDGYSFAFDSDKWLLSKDKEIRFSANVLNVEQDVLVGLKMTLARYAEEMSASHTVNMYHLFNHMVKTTSSKQVNIATILNWKAELGEDKEWYLGSLRGFLISWHDYGFKGIDSDVVELLERFTFSGNEKGLAVANRCPYSGAFTENEVLAINYELIRLYRENQIDLKIFSYVNLIQATAARSMQVRQIKIGDLLQEEHAYFINMPRAKQRGVGFRGMLKKVAITEDLYVLLKTLAEVQARIIEDTYNITLTERQRRLVPLFLDEKNFIGESWMPEMLDGDFLHASSTFLGQELLRRFTVRQRAISERTGDIICISTRRFRHTRGTNLGRKGYGAAIIAEALDHSDTQNVKVYTENTANTVQYIDEIIGKKLAPFASAFMGRIIETLDEGERGADPTARIPNDKNEVVGACGTNDFCVNGYESCYLCHKFRPLLDGPHELVLESLYKQKKQRLQESKSIEYASAKDRVILAVEQVVAECKRIKLERGQVNG